MIMGGVPGNVNCNSSGMCYLLQEGSWLLLGTTTPLEQARTRLAIAQCRLVFLISGWEAGQRGQPGKLST